MKYPPCFQIARNKGEIFQPRPFPQNFHVGVEIPPCFGIARNKGGIFQGGNISRHSIDVIIILCRTQNNWSTFLVCKIMKHFVLAIFNGILLVLFVDRLSLIFKQFSILRKLCGMQFCILKTLMFIPDQNQMPSYDRIPLVT